MSRIAIALACSSALSGSKVVESAAVVAEDAGSSCGRPDALPASDQLLLQVGLPSSWRGATGSLALPQKTSGWRTSSETSSHGEWCEADAPASDWTLKRCSASSSQSLDVKVLTYNLYWWNLFGEQFRNGNDGSAGKLIAEGGSETPFDFMGFQECEDVARVLKDANLASAYGTIPADHAIAIAYRKEAWKLLDHGMDEVAEDRAEQWYGKRGAQWARFEHTSSGKAVLFVNHHGPLPVGTGGKCGGKATAWQILKTIGTHLQDGDGVVLVGDFNAEAHSETAQELGERLHQVYTGTSFGGVDHVFSNCGGDNVLHTRNLGAGGSDHDALEVVVKV